MKHNWTYKKLGEIGQVITGSTPATKDERNYSSSDICFYKPSDLSAEKFTELKSSEFSISNYAYEHSRKLPKDSILTTCIGIIGKVGILTKEATCNQQINAIIPNQDIILSRFLGYAIISQKQVLTEKANAPVVPLLNKSQFSAVSIPVPSLSEQQAIVRELDGINHLIDLQEEQLREYDRLAQSLFYTTFGDPITNPKGWEVKKLGDFGTFERGNGFLKKDFVDDGFPCIHYGQIHTRFGEYITRNLTYIPHDLVRKSKIAHPGDVIIAITSEDLEGSCKTTAWLGEYDVAVGSHAAIFHHNQNAIYISYYTKTKAFYNEKEKYARGFKVMEIKPSDIAQIPIVLPPLALQQTFAAQVEAIEQQKALVRKSLEETRTLLAARMQYYFNS